MTTQSERHLLADRPAALKRLFEFMAIPSVSTDATCTKHCHDAANWLIRELTDIGFEARTIPAERHPIVLAHGPVVAGAPRVLFYGHYDVQPAQQEDGWDHPPFDPKILVRENRKIIHGRGAADDKGQVMTFVEACRALIQTVGMPVNVTMLIEGEEEIGSPSMQKALSLYADELSADIALICDTAMLNRSTPAMACQLRGFCGEIITIKAAKGDLHSGNYGGAARNPAQLLAEALASIKDSGTGAITLPGFYDDVPELVDEVRNDWARLAQFGTSLLPEVGLARPAGEAGRNVLEQVWARPCFDINSLSSGYLGEGFKTVLPATAQAKVSFRLVGAQDPGTIRETFRDAVRQFVPDDCDVHFEAYGTVAATQMDVTRPEFAVAKAAVRDLWPEPCVLIGMGGSIPVVGLLKAKLGMDSLLLGFGQADDNIHGVNEKLDLESFEKGAVAWLRFLQGLRQAGGQHEACARTGSPPAHQEAYVSA
jgi:acetylornithine deacetylase/succinyl-diaminopimelate desuccinylase-like protein